MKALRWPCEMTFPALDILRLSILNPKVHEYLLDDFVLNDLLSMFFLMIKEGMPANNQMLALRSLVNLFSTEKGELVPKFRALPVSRFVKLFLKRDICVRILIRN